MFLCVVDHSITLYFGILQNKVRRFLNKQNHEIANDLGHNVLLKGHGLEKNNCQNH